MKKFTKPIRKIQTLKDSLPIYTIPEMIEFTVNENGNNLAFLTPREGNIYQITYNKVYEHIKKLARHLRELGV